MESNSTYYDYEDDYNVFEDYRVKALLIALYSLVFFFCFFGNLTVVLVMSIHWKMRCSTKFCLSNLAFANLCVGIFCIYQDLSKYLEDNWILGRFLCKMYHFINSLTHTASILILVVIAVERYYAILHPFRCRRLFTTRRLRIILGVWIVSALLCSPRFYYIKTARYPLPRIKGQPIEYEVICTVIVGIFYSNTADTIQFVLLFLLPLIIISTLYIKVGLYLRRRESFVSSFIQSSKSSEAGSGERILPKDSPQNSDNENQNGSSSSSSTEGALSEEIHESNKDNHCVRFEGSTCPTSADILDGNDKNKSRCETTLESVSNTNTPDSTLNSGNNGAVSARRRSSAAASMQSTHKGVIRMLVAIVITFAVCNFPYHLRKIYQNFLVDKFPVGVWSDLSTPLTFLFMYSNCAINPILFAFMSQSFRSCCIDCLRCQIRKPSHGSLYSVARV